MTQKVVTPSAPMTDGQIDKAVDHYRNVLRKHRDEIGSSDGVQQVLGQSGYLAELLAVIRKHVEAVSRMFSRHVRVNRALTPDQVLDSTGRVRGYVDEHVLATMPGVGSGPEEIAVQFFELDYDPTPAELAKEYELRELVADGAALGQAMTDDPTLADERPVACQWDIDEDGAASYAVVRWRGRRRVAVHRVAGRWFRLCRFAGVPQVVFDLVPLG